VPPLVEKCSFNGLETALLIITKPNSKQKAEQNKKQLHIIHHPIKNITWLYEKHCLLSFTCAVIYTTRRIFSLWNGTKSAVDCNS
jgi:hypothetical protein